MTYYDKNALMLSHLYIKEHLKKGDVAVDATMGRGRDTLLLANSVGKEGFVYAFDIQKEALSSTEELLSANSIKNVKLILDSHENLKDYVKSAKAVVFNLGFLPGGDHSIFSRGDTTIRAITSALDILDEDGFISICSYYGGDTGFEERDSLFDFLKNLDQNQFTVMVHSFYNRKGNPPIFITIEKNRTK